MNWQCDVYVYADCHGGWTTHVASARRWFGPVPDIFGNMRLPRFGAVWNREARRMEFPSRWHRMGAWVVFGFAAFWHNRVHMASLHLLPLRRIGLAHDGESFNDATATECAERLESLRAAGYAVPQTAIDELRNEELVDCEPPNVGAKRAP